MEPISRYFNAEKSESLIFIIAGLLAVIIGVWFLFVIKKPFYNGVAFSITAIAIVQLTVGYSVYARSPEDIIRVNQIVKNDQAKIHAQEIPRMKTVMKNFMIYKIIEIVFVVAGLLFWIVFKSGLLSGIGLGLFIQALLMLVFDLFAESRGKIYISFLESLN